MAVPPDVRIAVGRRDGRPITHENGFIQLRIDINRRLHVWPDEPIARQDPPMPIHDHRFDFESEVIVGRLEHIVYRTVAPNANHPASHLISTVKGDEYVFHDKVCALVELSTTIHKGEMYHFNARTLHESKARGLTATIMTKTAVHEIIPRVLVPIGATHLKVLDRENANSQFVLWRIIDRALAATM
jgi:hypothetical protein